MACPRCAQIGKEPQIYIYAKDGRWQRLEICKHRTRRLWRETTLTRKPTPHNERRTYTAEMDAFIMLHYPKRRLRQQLIEKLVVAFEEKFGIVMSRGRIYGRYYRNRKRAEKARLANASTSPKPSTSEVHGASVMRECSTCGRWRPDQDAMPLEEAVVWALCDFEHQPTIDTCPNNRRGDHRPARCSGAAVAVASSLSVRAICEEVNSGKDQT